MSRLRIFALGGLDEDGKNMYIIENNDDIFVLSTITPVRLNFKSSMKNEIIFLKQVLFFGNAVPQFRMIREVARAGSRHS